jgi:hypothetical protein
MADVKHTNASKVQIGEVVQCKADFERIPISTTNNPLQVAFPSHTIAY